MPMMGHPAAERTPQIGTLAVARVGEKEDPALTASGQARPKAGFDAQDGTQDEVVLPDQLAHTLLVVPVRAGIEMPLDRYGKKPRRSLNRLMDCGMTSCTTRRGQCSQCPGACPAAANGSCA